MATSEDRPVTISRIAATIMTNGNERNKDSSAEIEFKALASPLIMTSRRNRVPTRSREGS